MSGPSAIRGFLLQSLVAILDSLRTADWHSVTLEPSTHDEKIDILWKFPSRMRAHQVKHSINRISATDVEKWAGELKASAPSGCELELTLLGHATAEVAHESKVGAVDVRFISMPEPSLLISSASHSLSRFLEAERLSDVPPVVREVLVQALASKLLEAATASKEVTRPEMRSLLKGWMLDSYPAAISATVERERALHNKELEGLRILASAQVHNRRWLFKQRAKSVKLLWASLNIIKQRFSQLLYPYKILLPSEFESFPSKGRLEDTTGTMKEHDHSSMLHEASQPVELARPFLPAPLLRQFYAYRTFVGRTALKVIKARDSRGRLADWRRDFEGRPEKWENFLLQTVPAGLITECSTEVLDGHGRIARFVEEAVLRAMNESLSANYDLGTHVRDHHDLIEALDRAKPMDQT